MKGMPFNFFAPISGYLGYNIHARNLAAALDDIGADIRLINSDIMTEDGLNDHIKRLIERGKETRLDIPAVNLTIPTFHSMARFGGSHRIGYSVLEISKIPDRWVTIFNALDGAWTATNWGKEVFESCGVEHDVKVIPEGVDPDTFNPSVEPYPEFSDGIFKFLTIGKWEKRKNLEGLCQAFAEEFGPDDDVVLLLQSLNPFIPNYNVYERLYNLQLPQHQPIIPIEFLPDEHALARLYVSCDAFVLPTRGEGWGLPFIEAMASGLPTIGTNWSGNTEFMNDDNSYLIDIEGFIPVEDPMFFAFASGEEWAEPDMEHCRALMREVYENREESREKALSASVQIRKDWNWSNAAEIAKKEVEKYV